MKRPFTKRERVITVVSVMLLIGAGMLISMLFQAKLANESLIENRNALIREQEKEANETAAYIETICAEYRKLYQSYREAKYPDPSSVDKYLGLPGSAKGNIDECYLPD